MSALDDLREAFRPAVAKERVHRATEPGVTDQPCCCCGLIWWCDRGQDGAIYCDICLGRGHDEADD